MTLRENQPKPLRQLHELTQFVPSAFCCDECRSCCRFSEPYWLPRVLAAEQELVGHAAAGLAGKGRAMYCGFLDAAPHHCRIYARRPFECRLYPFLLVRKHDTLDLAAHLGCPYVVRQLNTEEFKSYTRYLTDVLSLAPVRAIVRQEKGKFHTYPDIELYLVRRDIIRAARAPQP